MSNNGKGKADIQSTHNARSLFSLDDMEQITDRFKNIVYKLAHKFNREGDKMKFDELVQTGFVGLYSAIDRYKKGKKKTALFTFVYICVKSAMLNFLQKNYSFLSSLDEEDDEGCTLHEVIPTQGASLESLMEMSEIWNLVSILPKKQAEVINSRYKHGKTLEEVGDELDLTKERIRQIESMALDNLRDLVGITRINKEAGNDEVTDLLGLPLFDFFSANDDFPPEAA